MSGVYLEGRERMGRAGECGRCAGEPGGWYGEEQSSIFLLHSGKLEDHAPNSCYLQKMKVNTKIKRTNGDTRERNEAGFCSLCSDKHYRSAWPYGQVQFIKNNLKCEYKKFQISKNLLNKSSCQLSVLRWHHTFFFFFPSFQPHLWHTEVPGPGMASKLQLWPPPQL